MSTRRCLLMWALPVLLPLSVAHAAEGGEKDAEAGRMPIGLGIEYYAPAEDDRNIRTWNLNAHYPIGEIEAVNLSFGAVLTATYATGDITQLEGEYSRGTLVEVSYDNDALGIGPGVLADFRFLRLGKFSFHLDAGISVLFYTKDFPAGGDRYNFMERVGPVLRYVIRDGQTAGVGYHWMHVSNGQGLGSQNPSYEARGVSLYYSIVF